MPSPISTYTERRRLRLLDPTVRPLWSQRRIFLLAVAIGILLGIGILNGLWTLRATTNNCHRIAQLEQVIQIQVQRSIKTLPTISYYRQHPDELQHQLALARDEIRVFTPTACSPQF